MPNASSLYGALGTLSASRAGMLLGGYLVLVNLGSIGLFWYDKHQAVTKGWRVPEKTLQLSALMGGWIGGLWGKLSLE
jgi:uncharacterized membrane protein YsdA (DUF1294 family)